MLQRHKTLPYMPNYFSSTTQKRWIFLLLVLVLTTACTGGDAGSEITPENLSETLEAAPAGGGDTSELPAPEVTVVEPTPTVVVVKPEAVVTTYLEAWNNRDFSTMYSLLSPFSRANISQEDYIFRIKQQTQQLTLESLDFSILGALAEGVSAQVQYKIEFDTLLVGPLEREYLANLDLTDNQWGIVWDDALIMPELEGGNSLYMAHKIPARGNIYDTNGLALAAQADAVGIWLVPGLIDPEREYDMLEDLSTITGLHPEVLRQRYAFAGPDWYIPMGEATLSELQNIYDRLTSYPGVNVRNYNARYYHAGAAGAPHAVGYVSFITEEELTSYINRGYQGDEKIGRLGVERWGEQNITGTRGATLVVLNPDNTVHSTLADSVSTPAVSVNLTLDREFQRQVQLALQDYTGAAVVIDMNNGHVLAMASSPSFDPNWFDPGNPHISQLGQIFSDARRPLINRATQGLYPPASTFKVVGIAAALESGLFTSDQIIYCGHTWDRLGAGFEKRDWTLEKEEEPSGDLDMVGALRRSCDPWFYDIGYDLYQWDPDYFSEMTEAFGFGAPTNIVGLSAEVQEELAGLVPDTEWATNSDGNWLLGDSVNFSIGQGDLLTTPLQIANAYAAIGNGGTLYRPQLIQSTVDLDGNIISEIEPEVIRELPVSEATMDVLWAGLYDVIRHPKGTAYDVMGAFPFEVYGKTGTAEDPPNAPHAWFAGFTYEQRADKPDIAIAVIIENEGEGSEFAAPIYRRIVELYFNGRPMNLYPWEESYGLPSSLVEDETEEGATDAETAPATEGEQTDTQGAEGG